MPKKEKEEGEDEMYLMYNHLQWEDLVTWDNTQIKSPPAKHMDLLYFSGYRLYSTILLPNSISHVLR
jgi:hypothetical protein